VIKTVPIPPPGNIGNEPHHCHLNSTGTILGCGGLLSMLKGQNGIFFFDVTAAKNPNFLFSTKAVQSSMTGDFMPIENGGFLITQMALGVPRFFPGAAAAYFNGHSQRDRSSPISVLIIGSDPNEHRCARISPFRPFEQHRGQPRGMMVEADLRRKLISKPRHGLY